MAGSSRDKRKATSIQLESNVHNKRTKSSHEDSEQSRSQHAVQRHTSISSQLPNELQLQILHELVTLCDGRGQTLYEESPAMRTYGFRLSTESRKILSDLRLSNLDWDDTICSLLFHHINLPMFDFDDLRGFEQMLASADALGRNIKSITIMVWRTEYFEDPDSDSLSETASGRLLDGFNWRWLRLSGGHQEVSQKLKKEMFDAWVRLMMRPRLPRSQATLTPKMAHHLRDFILPKLSNMRHVAVMDTLKSPRRIRTLQAYDKLVSRSKEKLRYADYCALFGDFEFSFGIHTLHRNAETVLRILLQSMPSHINGLDVVGLPISPPQTKGKGYPLLGRQPLISTRQAALNLQHISISPNQRDYLEYGDPYTRKGRKTRFRGFGGKSSGLAKFWLHNLRSFDNLRVLKITSIRGLFVYSSGRLEISTFLNDLVADGGLLNLEHLEIGYAIVNTSAMAALLDLPAILTVKLPFVTQANDRNWYEFIVKTRSLRRSARSLPKAFSLEMTYHWHCLESQSVKDRLEAWKNMSALVGRLFICMPEQDLEILSQYINDLKRSHFEEVGVPSALIDTLPEDRGGSEDDDGEDDDEHENEDENGKILQS